MSYVYDLRELNFIVCLSVCLSDSSETFRKLFSSARARVGNESSFTRSFVKLR